MAHSGVSPSNIRRMALWISQTDHFSMYTSTKKPSVGDRVRRTGSHGVSQVIRVLSDGAFVDLKHLDLCGPNFIEMKVPASELTFLSASRPTVFPFVPEAIPGEAALPASPARVPRRSAARPQASASL